MAGSDLSRYRIMASYVLNVNKTPLMPKKHILLFDFTNPRSDFLDAAVRRLGGCLLLPEYSDLGSTGRPGAPRGGRSGDCWWHCEGTSRQRESSFPPTMSALLPRPSVYIPRVPSVLREKENSFG